jgi:hypothetical protein
MLRPANKKVDPVRLLADLNAAKVELLSAQCATDRVRLQYSPQDIVTVAGPHVLKPMIASAESLHGFFSQIAAQVNQNKNAANRNE